MANKLGGGIGVAVPALTSRADTNPFADAGSKFWAGQTLIEYTQYTQGAGSVAVTAGDALFYTDNDQQKVTSDVSSALNSGVNQCAGVAAYDVTAANSGKYIFILKHGPSEYPPGTDISLNTGNVTVVAGRAAMGQASTDGVFIMEAVGTAPTYQVVGWFSAAANGKANLVL